MIILGTNSVKDTGFNVDNSCRFNSADSAYMHKTPSGAGSTRKLSFSCWFKLTELSATRGGAYNLFHSVYDSICCRKIFLSKVVKRSISCTHKQYRIKGINDINA